MNIFSLEYSEYAIAGLLQDEFPKSDNYSISIPLKRQQKDYDLLLFNANNRKAVTIQIKSSRTYLEKNGYEYIAWLNNFKVNEFADFYCIYITYPIFDKVTFKPKSKFSSKILVFSNAEMAKILDNVKTKKLGNPDKFFGFGFNENEETIYGNRGFISEERQEFSANLFENKLAEIKRFIG